MLVNHTATSGYTYQAGSTGYKGSVAQEKSTKRAIGRWELLRLLIQWGK